MFLNGHFIATNMPEVTTISNKRETEFINIFNSSVSFIDLWREWRWCSPLYDKCWRISSKAAALLSSVIKVQQSLCIIAHVDTSWQSEKTALYVQCHQHAKKLFDQKKLFMSLHWHVFGSALNDEGLRHKLDINVCLGCCHCFYPHGQLFFIAFLHTTTPSSSWSCDCLQIKFRVCPVAELTT